VEIADIINRLHGHLRECNQRYPGAWRQIDAMRAQRQELGDWPAWCFCPLSASYAITCQQHGVESLDRYARVAVYSTDDEVNAAAPILDVSRVAALAAWRLTQGIYVIDPTVLQAVVETPMDGAIPVDVLLSLPEWCVYVPTAGHVIEATKIAGFFAWLEHDVNRRQTELRILIDQADRTGLKSLSPEILHLHHGLPFDESYDRMIEEMRKQAQRLGSRGDAWESAARELRRNARTRVGPLLSVLLYLCSQTAEYRLGGQTKTGPPAAPRPQKTKAGWRLFPPDRPRTWYVGEHLGHAIREALAASHSRHPGDERAGPRPHVRRAHWHSFWTGSRSDAAARKIVLKWLPPIPVAMVEDTPEARMKADRPRPIKNLEREIETASRDLDHA